MDTQSPRVSAPDMPPPVLAARLAAYRASRPGSVVVSFPNSSDRVEDEMPMHPASNKE